jgi:arylsulfatase A-like enzyme
MRLGNVSFKWLIPALLAGATWLTTQARGENAEQRPNILFVLTDDQRFDMLGVETPALRTPVMDRLGTEGVRFKNAFVTTSICAASRASILTGLVERTHGYSFMTPPLADSLVQMSFPSILRQAGYRTGYVGKFGVNVNPGAKQRLYDYIREIYLPYWQEQPDGSLRHLTDLEGEAAIQFLQEHMREGGKRPFCLTVGFGAPHAEDANPLQYLPKKEVEHLYENIKIPRPPLSDEAFYNHLPDFLRDGTMNRHRWWWRFDYESKRQEMTKGYWRLISGLDLVLGQILDALRQLDLASNTVVILMSDNGYFLGERGYAGKWLPYEPSLRVPLLVFDPRGRFSKPGLRPTAFALNIDIAPTILEIASAPIPARMQGRSLVPLLTGETPADWRKDIWFEHLTMIPTIRKLEGVRTEQHKYIRYLEASPQLEELYDLREDPLETINLVNGPKYRSLLQQLRRRTDQLRDQYGGEFSERIWKQPRP